MKEEGWAVSGDRSAVREGEGSWWAGPSSPFVVVGAGVALSSLAVLVVRWSPVVVRSLSFVRCRSFVVVRSLSFVRCRSFVVVRSFSSFVRVRRSCPSFVCIASLAPGVTQLGRGEVNGLAVDCHWAVDGGHVALVG